MHENILKYLKNISMYPNIQYQMRYGRPLSSRCCVLHIDSVEKDLSLGERELWESQ